ncbi:MAG: efflux RND transporter periplasmic adaptor subunit [Nitrospira sp.]|nr:efflux RND transporter periplasmic adaptor subunit [Nitrospira sp.]MDH4327511.1 efflux RND transporter periplasmic adaptor subunit [Nitrospira sp.]MDH5253414.1 efflux RND transporter periplasmic adaptor subunit [Nitrospira sp.]
MIVVKRFSVWIALAGIVFTAWILLGTNGKEPMPTPISEPPRSPYDQTVAASGIIEAVNENVRIAPPVAGLITKIFVAVGDKIKKQAPLFQLDDRDLRAQLVTREAAIPPLHAQMEEQQYRIGDLDTQWQRLKAVHDQRAVSEDDLKRTWYALEMAKRTLQRLEATVKQATAQRDEIAILLDRLTVRAPRDGTILQVNVRAGEYATLGSNEPLLLLGDTEQLQVRADVDEVNAPLVAPHAPGVASLKSMAGTTIPLTFVRIEPYVIPKKSLTGDNTERVDTRVLQIIYRFDRPPFPVYAGQQVDVFIERRAAATDRPRLSSVAPAEKPQ